MKDLLGLSGAASEIVKAVSRGIGTLYRPRSIRHVADAEAYAITVKARARAEAKIIIQPDEGSVEMRAVERFKTTLITQQRNIERIADQAVASAIQSDSESSSSIDPD